MHRAEALRRAQALTQEVWRLEGRLAPQHIGDIAWQGGRELGEARIEFWERDGEDVAWGWFHPPNVLDSCVRPDHRDGLVGELLTWFEDLAAAGEELVVWVQSTDAAMLESLQQRGYRLGELEPLVFNHRDLTREPVPVAPEGFRLRTVDPEDFSARVELHRVVWAPSKLTEETFRSVQATWPYRADLDCIVEAPDGQLAAYCLAWLDEQNQVGELEPVGTHPDFRRLGLGSAVCRYALHRLEQEGAKQAMVYSLTDPAQRLYESIGFREVSRALRYVKRR